MNQRIYLYTSDAGLLRYWQTVLGESCIGMSDPQQAIPADAILALDTGSLASWAQADWADCLTSARLAMVISTCPNDAEGYSMLKMGARAYCHALVPKALLHSVVSTVAAGGIWLGRTLMQRLLAAVSQLPSRPELLTVLNAKESAVCITAANGFGNKEIAHLLGISELMVKAHLDSGFEKLKVEDRLEMALYVNGIF